LKRVISGIMLTLLLTSMLTLAFNVQLTKAEWTGTVYIRADGSIDPPDAPIVTFDNITYTLTANITETNANADGIVVERSHIIIDGAGHKVEGAGIGGGRGFYLSSITNVTITNINIKHFWAGIYLLNSKYNTISRNNITANTEYGISFWGSSNNIISLNKLANNGHGILLYMSSNNILRNNVMKENDYNFYVLKHFIQDIDSSNTVDGKPIYYWINVRDLAIPSDAGYVALVNCTNITAKDLNLQNNGQGMLLVHTSNSTIVHNNIKDNKDGVYLYDSSNNNIISGNNITADNRDGILLSGSSNNSISGNNIIAECVGIYLEHSLNNTIFESNIKGKVDGVYLEYSSNNYISENNIQAHEYHYAVALVYSSNNYISRNNITNTGVGIYLGASNYNMISGNNITNNSYGILLRLSLQNNFWHNNIIYNIEQVRISVASYSNIWDDGYPSGGNYWSDYTGVDLYSGPYQNVSGSDGIGDTPYVIDENNVDRYPLMSPWSPKPVYVNATVDVNPEALNLRSWGKWITAYVELPEGYDVADIDVSTIMLNGTVPVDLCAPIVVGDYDNDSVPDLMVGFNGTLVSDFILSSGVVFGNVTLTLTGQLYSGTFFEGSDIILVSALTGDINVDGKVDMRDLSIVALAFGSYPGDPRWNPEADINGDNKIDMRDLVLICKNFGNSYP